MDNKEQLMNEINLNSFAVNDLTLYLDTHPDDKEAVEMFTACLEKRTKAIEEYESSCHPLTIDSIKNLTSKGYHWSWSGTPLPWEGGIS